MPFNSETARKARQVLHGQGRAAFWRELGFPNLVLAHAARRRNAAARREAKACAAKLEANPRALVEPTSNLIAPLIEMKPKRRSKRTSL